jgi:uncharacterized cupredoxin-like copper-binding protein
VERPACFRLPVALVLAVAASTLASACGSTPQRAPAGELVAVSEADFKISATHGLTAGDVVFRVHNKGPDQHEFIIARSPSAVLPIRKDGVTIDEETLEKAEVGALEPGAPGVTRELKVNLAPGRYVLFCNMTGHYMGGMHSTLVVRQ